MNIPWKDLIDLFKYIVDNCKAQGRTTDQIKESMADPGPREIIAVRRALRRKGIRGTKRREYLDDIQDVSKRVTGTLIDEIMEEIEAQDD